jgi:hypothetical protein
MIRKIRRSLAPPLFFKVKKINLPTGRQEFKIQKKEGCPY